jgi:hypothetical protein
MGHYRDPNKGFQGNTGHSVSFIGCEQGGPHRDHKQVDDWRMFKCSKERQVKMRQSKVKKWEESAPALTASMTTGIIKTTLLWSEHRTQARQTTTPSATIN